MTAIDTVSPTFTNPHRVLFYGREDDLIIELADYVGAALLENGSALVVASPEHRHALRDALSAPCYATALAQERLLILDADAVLDGIMRNGRPDPVLFDQVVSSAVRRQQREVGILHIYGEMVANLAYDGNLDAAMELEDLWNARLNQSPCELLCAYPLDQTFARQVDGVARIARRHTSVHMTSCRERLHVFNRPAARNRHEPLVRDIVPRR